MIRTSYAALPEPISPLDPHGLRPSRITSTDTQGAEFFSAVYLDSPSLGLDERLVGRSTKPLRVRKRAPLELVGLEGSKFATNGLGQLADERTARRRRRSTVSVPQSPRSPRLSRGDISMPASPVLRHLPIHTNTTSSTSSSTQAHHSISRIFLAPSPLVISPPPPLPHKGKTGKQRISSVTSDLHLGLGRFGSYAVSPCPGPSPPPSPVNSPKAQRHHNSPPRDIEKYRSKPLPPSPPTPSRAPPKAAKLLGVDCTNLISRSTKQKSKRHDRPLPTQTLVEIERFLGHVPRKPSKTPPGLKNPSRTRPTTSHPIENQTQNIGQGATVRHTGGDGSMWLDVEEEQEFAWLMSDMINQPPLPLSSFNEQGQVVNDENEDETGEYDQWGMGNFTSVLNIPKLKSSHGKSKKKTSKDETFLELDSPGFGNTTFGYSLDMSDPWSRYPSSSSPPKKPAQPAPTQLATPPPSETESTASSGRNSPPRGRDRPQPLTLLAKRSRDPNLPIISATSSATHPTTPFTRPRRAPTVPILIPANTTPPVPPVPILPASIPGSLLPIDHVDVFDPPAMSYFEPITPVDRTHRVINGGTAAATRSVESVKTGGAWLKKVVKPNNLSRVGRI